MPRSPEFGGGSTGQVSYPIGHILETAAQMMTNANNALADHEVAWGKVQSYVQRFPGFMQGTLMAVLDPYDRRLRASYQWQLDLANTLIDGVNAMEGTDNNVAKSFPVRNFGPHPIS